MNDVAPLVKPEGIRWDVVVMAGACVAILAGVALSGFERGEVDPTPSERIALPDDVAFGAPLRVERTAVAAPARGGPGGEIQLCSGEWITADADGKPDAAALADAQARAYHDVERIALGRMLASGDGPAVATALWHRAVAGRARPMRDSRPDVGAAAATALVEMALTSQDPEVYATAWASCAHDPRAGRCALLNAAQWARLDAENAFAWLARVAEANAEGDRAAEDDALWRIARAPRFDSGFASTIGHLLAHAPDDDEHVAGTFALGVHMIGIMAALPLRGLSKSCTAEAIVDATRRERCDAAAATLVARGDTLTERAIGASFGRRLGWPADRLRDIGEELNALQAASPSLGEGAAAPTQCAAIRRDLDWLRQVASFGETGALARAATARTVSSGR